MAPDYHCPVLLKESVEHLVTDPEGLYIDTTFGGGGHSRAVLDRISDTKGKLIAFDRDKDALRHTLDGSNFGLIHADFRYLKNFLKYFDLGLVSGILADLGVSSHQIDTVQRGFSFRGEAPLDMRMSSGAGGSAGRIFREYSQEKIETMLSDYGDIRGAAALSRAIVGFRKERKKKEYTTWDLVETCRRAFDLKEPSNKLLAQVFQAFRIEVNREIDALKELLVQARDFLVPGGRLCVICYHSLESIEVKKNLQLRDENDQRFFKKVCTVKPPFEEVRTNNRARSAILRVIEKMPTRA